MLPTTVRTTIQILLLSIVAISCKQSDFAGSGTGASASIENLNPDGTLNNPLNPAINTTVNSTNIPGSPIFDPGLFPVDPSILIPNVNPFATPIGGPNIPVEFLPNFPQVNAPNLDLPNTNIPTEPVEQCPDHVAFVTSSWLQGNQVNPGGDAQLTGADAICQSHARQANLCPTKTFKAVLSSSTVDAKDRIQITSPVFNNAASRQQVVANQDQFWEKNGWQALITFDERRAAVPNDHPSLDQRNNVWTGSNHNGTRRRSQNCSNFTSTSGLGGAGSYYERDDVLFDGTWGAPSCRDFKKLYCISQ